MPPVAETLTRTASGERRSEVLKKAGSAFTPAGAIERFEEFEKTVETLEKDIRIPDAYRRQQIDEARTALHEDFDRMEVDVMAARYVALVEEEKQAMQDLKQGLTGSDAILLDLATVDRSNDVSELVDLAEEAIALGHVARNRRLLPAIVGKLTTLATTSTDQGVKASARAVRQAADDWRREHPSVAARLRDIRARRDAVDHHVGTMFSTTRTRLGMKPL